MAMNTSTRLIGPEALGLQTWELLQREVVEMTRVLSQLDEPGWTARIAFADMTLGQLVQHLAEDARRLADTWERHYSSPDEPVFLVREDPDRAPELSHEPSTGAEAHGTYLEAVERLNRCLSRARQDDWVWPSGHPFGGEETLAGVARRWLAHHYIHRMDLHEALGLPIDREEDTVRLVTELVMDILVRIGREVVPAPMSIEFRTAMPGAGSWLLVFEGENGQQPSQEPVWQKLLAWRPDALPSPRVERGAGSGARVRVRGDGEEVWRAAFRRGGDWSRLKVHGDDEALKVWSRLLECLEKTGGPELATAHV